MRIAMTWRDARRQFSPRVAPGSRALPAAKRPTQVRLAGSKDTRGVAFEGKPVEVAL